MMSDGVDAPDELGADLAEGGRGQLLVLERMVLRDGGQLESVDGLATGGRVILSWRGREVLLLILLDDVHHFGLRVEQQPSQVTSVMKLKKKKNQL